MAADDDDRHMPVWWPTLKRLAFEVKEEYGIRIPEIDGDGGGGKSTDAEPST